LTTAGASHERVMAVYQVAPARVTQLGGDLGVAGSAGSQTPACHAPVRNSRSERLALIDRPDRRITACQLDEQSARNPLRDVAASVADAARLVTWIIDLSESTRAGVNAP
jgi:hypothetical protein